MKPKPSGERHAARRFPLSTTHLILLSFLAAILVGSLLLSLPVASATGEPVPYIDALFTATTSACVTGLVTLPTVSAWSTFGHVVILLLIQIGGLGVITVLSGVMLAFSKRMGIGDRLLLQDAFNLNTLAGISAFLRKVILGTFAVEGVGALLYMTVFVPEFGARGIWISVFNAVSAFCNAGIDIIAEDSLCRYATHPTVNFVTMTLIFLSGIGYIVWWDVLRVARQVPRRGIRAFTSLTLHSKIALSATVTLIFGGALLLLIFEYDNPATFGSFGFFEKVQAALFQSVTTRTAGFATVPQSELSSASAIVSLLLMFIGGSPVGTAGGIKTVTVAVLAASAISTVSGKESVTLFHRTVAKETVEKAAAVTATSFFIVLLSTLLLANFTDAPLVDLLYETVSATATVGLSRDLTPTLNAAGKLTVIVTMYLGRVGPISLAVAFGRKREPKNLVKDPTEEISVG